MLLEKIKELGGVGVILQVGAGFTFIEFRHIKHFEGDYYIAESKNVIDFGLISNPNTNQIIIRAVKGSESPIQSKHLIFRMDSIQILEDTNPLYREMVKSRSKIEISNAKIPKTLGK